MAIYWDHPSRKNNNVVLIEYSIYLSIYHAVFPLRWVNRDKERKHTPTHTLLSLALREEKCPAQSVRSVTQIGMRVKVLSTSVLNFAPATSLMTHDPFHPWTWSDPRITPDAREPSPRGIKIAASLMNALTTSPHSPLPYYHPSLLHRHSFYIQRFFTLSIHPIRGFLSTSHRLLVSDLLWRKNR